MITETELKPVAKIQIELKPGYCAPDSEGFISYAPKQIIQAPIDIVKQLIETVHPTEYPYKFVGVRIEQEYSFHEEQIKQTMNFEVLKDDLNESQFLGASNLHLWERQLDNNQNFEDSIYYKFTNRNIPIESTKFRSIDQEKPYTEESNEFEHISIQKSDTQSRSRIDSFDRIDYNIDAKWNEKVKQIDNYMA